jgi:branched-chain amino acid transport system permease protein
MLERYLPAGSRARQTATIVALFAVMLVITQLFMPGPDKGGAGTPLAVHFQAIVSGLCFSLASAGLVLVHRTLRIINFSQMALGTTGAVFFFELVYFTSVPYPIALVLGVAIGAFAGVLFDVVFGRRFYNSPRVVLTVLTIVSAPFLASFVAPKMALLGIFPHQSDQTLEQLSFTQKVQPLLPLSGWHFNIGSFGTVFGFPDVMAIELSIIALLGLGAFLRFTRVGVAVRALAENSERAALLGISVGTMSSAIWALSGGLSAVGGIALGSVTLPGAAVGIGAFVLALIVPLVAAVLARFESIPVAVFATVGIFMFVQALNTSYPDQLALSPAFLFVLLGFGLLVNRRRMGRSEVGAGVTWAAVREIRPIPAELSRITSVRAMRWGSVVLALVFVTLWPFIVSPRLVSLGAVIAIQSVIGVSLVVLTGWTGQVSLGQVAFAAIGATVGGALTTTAGVPFWFAVPIATAVSAGVAALIGIPALRIKGLFLGALTLAFAFAVRALLFDEHYFGWLLPTKEIKRPTLFLLDFDNDTTMYFLCVACLVLSVFVVFNLRRSRFGRLLIALRENEANVQAFGVSAARLKVTAFAVSGALAGFSGAVLVHQQRSLTPQSFEGQRSLDVFTTTVLGGISSPVGALLGATFDNFQVYFGSTSELLRTILDVFRFGGIALVLLYVAPGGLISVVAMVRDSILRIIAQRRQIVVPSLFADYDADALERRLVPLAESDPLTGLAARGGKARYRLRSAIHGPQPEGEAAR